MHTFWDDRYLAVNFNLYIHLGGNIRNIYILLLLSTFLYSATINVPDDYPTIQEGIDASQDGHTVLVANGDNNLLPKNKTFDFNHELSIIFLNLYYFF